MHFKLRKERINTSAYLNTPSLLVNVSGHILLAVDAYVHVYSYDGTRVRSLALDSRVVVMRSEGGREGKEAVLLGKIVYCALDTVHVRLHTYIHTYIL